MYIEGILLRRSIIKMRKIFVSAIVFLSVANAFAQSGTKSPYSQYGFGTLAPQSTSFNRGMAGVAYGFHDGNTINYANPASYSSVDSLSFIFDAGVSLNLTNYTESGKKRNVKNSELEYIAATFRVFKHVGVSFGLIPFSNVGYDFSNSQNVNAFPSTSSANATYSNTYHGEGGIHEVYVGAAWQPVKNFSFGANIGYLWGDLYRTVTNSYSDSYVNTLSRAYSTSVKSYKLDLGAQYTFPVTKKDNVTLGVVYSLGHKLNSTLSANVISTNSQTSVSDTTNYNAGNGLKMPHIFGAGLMWNHNNKLKVGVDYQLQKWGSLLYPVLNTSGNTPSYTLADNQFKDRHRFALGVDYSQGERYRGFFKRLHYQAGVSYTTPYVKINGQDGPKEITASLGFGIPIINNYNNRSMLHISAEWANIKASNMIKENVFRINVGFTFNERWFSKFKVE